MSITTPLFKPWYICSIFSPAILVCVEIILLISLSFRLQTEKVLKLQHGFNTIENYQKQPSWQVISLGYQLILTINADVPCILSKPRMIRLTIHTRDFLLVSITVRYTRHTLQIRNVSCFTPIMHDRETRLYAMLAYIRPCKHTL